MTLILETTLDKGQLVNFIDGLRNPVHLTQGPPGTGKSYLGVVLVRALLRIRTLWMQQNPSVGCPPILVLSYKNHAADEFLCDFIQAERSSPSGAPYALVAAPAVHATRWHRSQRHGIQIFNALPVNGRIDTGPSSQQLIRIGTPGDPRLQHYSESSFKRADPARTKCHQALEELNDMATACKSLSKHALLFGSFRADMFGAMPLSPSVDSQDVAEDPHKRQNRAAYEATERLLSTIVRAKLVADILSDAGSHLGRSIWAEPDDILKGMSPLLTLDAPNDARCPKTQQLLSRRGLFSELPKLYSGLQHYIELDPRYDDPAEMLFMFIKGLQPLPRCAYTLGSSPDGEEQLCSNLSTCHEVGLCSEHRCFLILGRNQSERCPRPLAPGQRHLCSSHACMSTNFGICGRLRLGLDYQGQTAQAFCELHCCFKCVQLGQSPAGEAQDDRPRHVCCDHPLCCECQELALPNEDYCVEHATPKCQHSHPSGVCCSKPAIARGLDYCEEHISAYLSGARATWEDEAEDSDASGGEDEFAMIRTAPKPCQGRNKRGKPCGAQAMTNSKYCHAHAPPAASFTQVQKDARVLKEPVAEEATTSPPGTEAHNAPEGPPALQPDPTTGQEQAHTLVVEHACPHFHHAH